MWYKPEMKTLDPRQTDKQDDYCNPLAHALRINRFMLTYEVICAF